MPRIKIQKKKTFHNVFSNQNLRHEFKEPVLSIDYNPIHSISGGHRPQNGWVQPFDSSGLRVIHIFKSFTRVGRMVYSRGDERIQ